MWKKIIRFGISYEMDSLGTKCYHVSGAGIQTASVGTQSCIDGGLGTTNPLQTTNPNSNNNGELTLTKSKAQLNSGNYINIVPMPMNVQYHQRRKYSPQIQSDYQ